MIKASKASPSFKTKILSLFFRASRICGSTSKFGLEAFGDCIEALSSLSGVYVAPLDPTGGEGEACAAFGKLSMTGDAGVVRQAKVTETELGERAVLLWETLRTKAGEAGSIWAIDESDWDMGRQWSAPAMAISLGMEQRGENIP